MSTSYEAHRLVIQHMAVLESAPAIVSEVETRVFGEIDKKIETWVSTRDEWEGWYDYLEAETSFKPSAWPKTDKDIYAIYFQLGLQDDAKNQYLLTPLIGADATAFGIWFSVDAPAITKIDGTRRAKAEWESFLADAFPKSGLSKRGFELRKGHLLLPICIDAAKLADAYPDALEDALQPVDTALATLAESLPEFDQLFEAIKVRFWQNDNAVMPLQG